MIFGDNDLLRDVLNTKSIMKCKEAPWWEVSNEYIGFEPRYDIIQGEESYSIRVAAPGFDKQDIDISIKDHVLTVSGQKKQENEGFAGRGLMHQFAQSFPLPSNVLVSPENVMASLDKGILTVTMSVEDEKKKVTKIEIK